MKPSAYLDAGPAKNLYKNPVHAGQFLSRVRWKFWKQLFMPRSIHPEPVSQAQGSCGFTGVT